MTDHASFDRFAHLTRPLANRAAFPTPRAPLGSRQHLRTMSRGRSCTARCAYSELDPIPSACLDDYLGGRCDRIGRDLLFDLRPWAESVRRPLTCALALAAPCTARDVVSHVRRLSPDLVWLYAGDVGRAQIVARRIVETGVETIIIHRSDGDW